MPTSVEHRKRMLQHLEHLERMKMSKALAECIRGLRQAVRDISDEKNPVEDRMIEVANAIEDCAAAIEIIDEKFSAIAA